MSVSQNLKQLNKDTFFYGMGSALQRFIGFFLFPIYTRLLSQEDFGAQDLVFTSITIASYFLILGLDSATARHYYDTSDPGERRTILSTWLFFELLLSIPISVLLIAFADPISALAFGKPELAPYFRIGIASLPFSLTVGVTMMALRLTFQSQKFTLVSVSGILVQTAAAILLVVVLRQGIRGVFLAQLAANVFRAFLGIVITRKQFCLRLSGRWLRPMLAYGLPLLPASLSLWVLNSSNRYFLVRFADLGDVGLLAVAVRISTILTFLITAFQTAWGPFAFSFMQDQALAKATYSRSLTYFSLATLSVTVGLTAWGRELVIILATPQYEPSAALIPWLCLSSIAWGAVYIVGMGYRIAKKSYHTTIAVVLGAGVNLGLNFLLIPAWGVTGAAASTLLGNLSALAYNYYAGQHYFHVPYEHRRLTVLVTVTACAIIASLGIDHSVQTWSPVLVLYKALISSLFFLALYALGGISRRELAYAHTFWDKRPRVIRRRDASRPQSRTPDPEPRPRE